MPAREGKRRDGQDSPSMPPPARAGSRTFAPTAGLAPPAPTIDFDAVIVVVIERPGNACHDRLVGFDIAGTTWTSVFEPTTEACEDIGVTWVYTIAIDRTAIAGVTTFTVPADEALGLEAVSTLVDLRSPVASQADPEVDVIGAGPGPPVGSNVSVPLPAPGTVASEWTREFGPLWVIHHDDGSVSILPSVVTHVDGTADGSDLRRRRIRRRVVPVRPLLHGRGPNLRRVGTDRGRPSFQRSGRFARVDRRGGRRRLHDDGGSDRSANPTRSVLRPISSFRPCLHRIGRRPTSPDGS